MCVSICMFVCVWCVCRTDEMICKGMIYITNEIVCAQDGQNVRMVYLRADWSSVLLQYILGQTEVVCCYNTTLPYNSSLVLTRIHTVKIQLRNIVALLATHTQQWSPCAGPTATCTQTPSPARFEFRTLTNSICQPLQQKKLHQQKKECGKEKLKQEYKDLSERRDIVQKRCS